MWDFPNPGWPESPLRKQRKGIFNRLKLDRLGFSWGHFFSVGWEKWEMKANIDRKQVLITHLALLDVTQAGAIFPIW